MRRIRRDEIEKTARIMAECFYDYPLYNIFFPGEENRIEKVFYFFWIRMYTRQNYSYVADDEALVCSIKKPGDKDTSALGLILNPRFLFGFLRTVPFSAVKRVLDYAKMEAGPQSRHYDPKRDWYFQTVCVLKQSRGSGLFFRAVREMDEGAPIFCETHTERNERLYHRMGLRTVETQTWYGVTHYVMRREAIREEEST